MDVRDESAPLHFSKLEPIALSFSDPSEQSITELARTSKPLIQEYMRLLRRGEKNEEFEDQTNAHLATLNQKKLYEFTLEVNQEIDELNVLIEQFNQTDSLDVKTDVLQIMKQKVAAIDARYPENVIGRSSEYRRQFYAVLGQEIQRNSLQLIQMGAPLPASKYQYRLSELLDNMSQDKLNRLLAIMCDNANYDDELEELYRPEEPEYEEFMAFIQTHSIVHEGGKNSTNFKVKRLKSKELPYVLKIENRVNQPKEIAAEIQASVEVILRPDISRRGYFERQQRGESKLLVRSAMVQPYFLEGSLFEYAMTKVRPHEKMNSALAIYSDMARILQRISAAGGAFPDMKNSNWLIEDEKLLIADDKSFRRQNADGSLDVFSDHSQWYGDILKSPQYMPPEVHTLDPISVEAMHVYSWGKNLYEFLILDQDNLNQSYFEVTEGCDFNFNYSVFRLEPEGSLLKQLITNAVRRDAEDRISLQDGLAQLEHVQFIRSLRMEIPGMLKEPLPFSLMTEYVQSILILDKSALEGLNPDTVQRGVEPFIQRYRAEYQEKFARKFQEINSILEKCPHEDLRAAVLAAKMEHQTLRLTNFDQFDADLDGILDAAQELEQSKLNDPRKFF